MLVLPLERPRTLLEAAQSDTPVVLFCLNCGKARRRNSHLVHGEVGDLPLGAIVGRYGCQRCRERLAVILPWYAATPREWVKTPEAKQPVTGRTTQRPDDHDGLLYAIESWLATSGADKLLGRLRDLGMAHAAFDKGVISHPNLKMTLRIGARVLRDSARPDVRPVD